MHEAVAHSAHQTANTCMTTHNSIDSFSSEKNMYH